MNGIILAKLTFHKCGWSKNQILFLQSAFGGSRMVFGVPICRAEQRRIGGGFRSSAVRIPQQLTVCVSCQVEFRWPPGKPSSTGNKRKLGCISFGYLFFGQAKKSNSPKRRKATSKTTTTAWAFMPTLRVRVAPGDKAKRNHPIQRTTFFAIPPRLDSTHTRMTK